MQGRSPVEPPTGRGGVHAPPTTHGARRSRRAPRPAATADTDIAAGCLFPSGPAETRVRVRVQERAPIMRAMLGATRCDGHFAWTLPGSDFETDGDA